MRLVFMGTPDFAVPALEALIAAGHEIATVYTQPPRPAKRGQKDQRSAVHKTAEAHDLPVETPLSLKEAATQEKLAQQKPEVIVVAAYGQILPRTVLDLPPHGCLNIHASLLPRWRGASPIQRAILAGDQLTGITIMKMAEGLDTGPMGLHEAVVITSETTAGELHDQLAALGAQLIVIALKELATGGLTWTPQDDAQATYAPKLEKDELWLDWRESATVLERQVRAFAPGPGARFALEKEPVKVLAASVEPSPAPQSEVGTVLDEALLVQTGEQALRLLTLQRPGKTPLAAQVFLRGRPVEKGIKFS